MLKLHIEDIIACKDTLNPAANPGPGKYEATKGFGTLGMNKTFSAKLPYEGLGLRRQKKLPGPVTYEYSDVIRQSIKSSLKINSPG